jgi:outer membrane protein OmpA-like peptidoglycan-associated protein
MKHPKSALALTVTLGFLLAGGCASQHSSTQPCKTPWTGTCRLKSVNKIAERESPVPYVVYEGLYEPVNGPGDVMVAHVNVEGRAMYENAIAQHLQKSPEVPCEQTVDAECFPGNTVAHVPQFVPPAEEVATGPVGCKALEEQNINASPQANQKGAESLPEQLDFEPGTTEIAPASRAALEGVAARLMGDASLQCVAIVSQSAPGEAAGLAEQRTWAIRRLLVERGVPGERLQTYALQPAFSGPGAEPMTGMTVERKVRFKVLIKK